MSNNHAGTYGVDKPPSLPVGQQHSANQPGMTTEDLVPQSAPEPEAEQK